jgi:hypothetical protein
MCHILKTYWFNDDKMVMSAGSTRRQQDPIWLTSRLDLSISPKQTERRDRKHPPVYTLVQWCTIGSPRLTLRFVFNRVNTNYRTSHLTNIYNALQYRHVITWKSKNTKRLNRRFKHLLLCIEQTKFDIIKIIYAFLLHTRDVCGDVYFERETK